MRVFFCVYVAASAIAFTATAQKPVRHDVTPFILMHDDVITTKDGKKLSGKILKEDSAKIEFAIIRNNKSVNTFLTRDKIATVEYGTSYEVYPTILGRSSLGLGYGLEYGGFGGNFTVYPVTQIGLFAGLGGTSQGAGFNAGMKLRLVKKRTMNRVVPYFAGMYGYNTIIKLQNSGEMFSGLSMGLGIDFHLSPPQKGVFSIAFYRAFPSAAADAYVTKARLAQSLDDPYPWLKISIGYRFVFD